MGELLQKVAAQAINPALFLWGMGLIYVTGLVLLVAVVLKFLEHAKNPQGLTKKKTHAFSTKEMMICVLALFPFWVNSFGQIPMTAATQSLYFALGTSMILLSVLWHLWAKINIRFMWSDGIEIKENHRLITTGAFALARHPMYASLLLWCWGASFLMMNGITLALVSFVFLPLMIKRARDEEKELVKVQPDYVLYQQNVRMLTPALREGWALAVKLIVLVLFGYFVWVGIDGAVLLLLFSVHLYLGYSLTPEKVAFSYRSKAGMMVVIWGLSLVWPPLYNLLYITLAMFTYGLKFDCPCMLVYNKYQRCPCFALAEKCFLKK